MTLYPGTEDWTRNVPRIFDNNWTNYTGSKVVFHHDHLPGEVIEQKIRKAYLTFYNPLRRWDLVLKNVAGVNPRRLYRILKTQTTRQRGSRDGSSQRLHLTSDGQLGVVAACKHERGAGAGSRCRLAFRFERQRQKAGARKSTRLF